MKHKILILIVLTFIISSSTILARIVIPPINGPIIKKISVFIPDLTLVVGGGDEKALEFVDVLRNDLLNAGLFDVHDAKGMPLDRIGNINFQAFFDAGAEELIKGEYNSSGERIQIAARLFDVAQEKDILGRSYEATPGKVREAAHRFASAVMTELTGIEGFFNSKIVFVSGAGQNRDLYIMDYDGRNIKRLTSHRSLLLSPHCSSDGTKIVFSSDKVWSQDIYVLSLVPRIEERRLTHALRLDQSPEWSQDGSKIAYSENGDIFVSNPDGSSAINLTHSPAIDVSPTWSPDGRLIAFVSNRSGVPQIYVMNSDGSNVRRITLGAYDTDPSWSPNFGINRIVFVRVEGSEANIFTISPDGTDEHRLTRGVRRNENPSWSPDGHYITFSSTRSGAKNIYVMYLNGENQRPLTKDGGKSFPAWCR
jgi:TolB protein